MSNCNVICLNEHWLHSCETLFYVSVDFVLAAAYCREGSFKVGGSAIYVKENVSFEILNLLNFD